MPFTRKTKDAAFFRQWNRCGYCRRSLISEMDEAHHIIPQHLGGTDDVDNCVILCIECHGRVHNDFKFRSGIVLQEKDFKYLNG